MGNGTILSIGTVGYQVNRCLVAMVSLICSWVKSYLLTWRLEAEALSNLPLRGLLEQALAADAEAG
jgi:hypothetical protein